MWMNHEQLQYRHVFLYFEPPYMFNIHLNSGIMVDFNNFVILRYVLMYSKFFIILLFKVPYAVTYKNTSIFAKKN